MPVPTEKEIRAAVELLRNVGHISSLRYNDGEKFIVIILRDQEK